MKKIDTYYKQKKKKILAKLFQPFNRDCFPLTRLCNQSFAEAFNRDLFLGKLEIAVKLLALSCNNFFFITDH